MKKLFCCKFADGSGNPDITAEFLTAMNYQFSSWTDREHGITFHFIYSENKADAEKNVESLNRLKSQWTTFGIKIPEIKILEIRKEDWSEAWKKYFKIQHVTKRLVIKPSWLEYIPGKPEKTVIELDPGMSFGTGRHATTRFCLRMIDKLADVSKARSFLDAGCGSGILTIAAVKLGYHPISAFDNDLQAISCAKGNLEKNNINPANISLFKADLAEIQHRRQYDVVVANILANVLLKNREKLFSLTKPGGFLIIAGILTKEYSEVRNAFRKLGLLEKYHSSGKEWAGGVFYKRETSHN